MQSPLKELFDKATRLHHPLSASFELTYACNLACRFCYNPVQRPNQTRTVPPAATHAAPLHFEEIVDLFDQLRAMGVLYLTLTGGEPMIHPRFWDVAAAAKERSFAIRVFTNGTLIDPKAADQLAELAPYCIELSIHGACAASAEALNHTPGSHEAQLRALELLKDRGVRVFIKCVVTKLVENELEAIHAIGQRFGIAAYFDPVLTPSDDGQAYPLELAASEETLLRLYSSKTLNVGNSPFQREPGQYNCSVGTGILHVTPFGDVQPCVQWKQAIGNLREKPLRKMWEESELLQKVREASLAAPAMLQQTVEDHAFCMHCPGLSQLRSGDPLQPEEQYMRLARIRRRAAQESAGNPV
jgi:radical SAM protein with 4Fe4S-binding SPASM domain